MGTKIMQIAEKQEKLVGAAFDYLWKHPETGYKEWKSHAYLAEQFEALGYILEKAGNIPGFTAEVDTGREGPTVAVFGELDGLIVPTHPEADPETGAVHACGHCQQGAALLGLAAALKEPGALDCWCGKIRLVAVPAEELIEIPFREQLRKDGVIRYFGGKPEFLYRGLLDGVDISFMLHSTAGIGSKGLITRGSNGCMTKQAIFHGVSAHAGAAPHRGRNALYAATQALSAVNALRETFCDPDHVRVHPILTEAGSSVNAIPDRVVLECYVRAADTESIVDANVKVNRALAASAAALGCTLTIDDKHGYHPRMHDRGMMELTNEAMEETLQEVKYEPEGWGTGCSDMGDMTMLMPAIHPFIGGAEGASHGDRYTMPQGTEGAVCAVKVYLTMLQKLLANGAERAKQIVAEFEPVFSSKEEYFRHVDAMTACWEAVQYRENGSVIILPTADADSNA